MVSVLFTSFSVKETNHTQTRCSELKKNDMIIVKHRFLDHQVNPETETLIIGTFNPETTNNDAEFFYSRSRNYLWRLLPTAFGESDLKAKSKQEKVGFIQKYKIDFTDLIEEIQVEEGQEANYYDGFIDNKVTQWKNVIELIDRLPNLKRVCFTRKSFSDIQNMKMNLDSIQQHCDNKKITFKTLTTPARFYREDKQTEWTKFLLDGNS